MNVQIDEAALDVLLKRLASSPSLSIDDITLLANAFRPSSSRLARATAYLCLSKACSDLNSKQADGKTIHDAIFPYIDSIFHKPVPKIQEIENDEDAMEVMEPEVCVSAVSLLTALFPIAPSASTSLLTGKLGDEGDSLGILLELAELPSPLQPSLAELFVAAADTKQGRDLALTRGMDWLKGGVKYEGGNGDVAALCAAALSKLSGSSDARHEIPQSEGQAGESMTFSNSDNEELAKKMMAFVENSSSNYAALQSTIEGLAVLSLRPRIKVLLSSSPKFLKALIDLSPVPGRKGGSLPLTPRGRIDADNDAKLFESVETSFCYGLASILVNLTSLTPVLSEQDQEVEKLRKMAISADKNKLNEQDEDTELDSNLEVLKRVKVVLAAGCVNALSGLARTESRLVKEAIGRLCRNLVDSPDEEKDRRELMRRRVLFVKDGGFKVLSIVVRDLLAMATAKPSTKASDKTLLPAKPAPVDILPSFQALAKLVITTDPATLFPPPHQVTALNALTPLYHLLIHPDSLLIQRFEALMALTNITSIDPTISAKLVKASIKPLKIDGLFRTSSSDEEVRVITKVEEMMLDDNELARRAAVQLVCNLSSSQTGYDYFSGEDSTTTPSRARPLLNILVILTCMDDVPTQSAAGGALAMLTESPIACKYILMGDIQSSSSADQTPPRSPWSRICSLLEPAPEVDYDESAELIPIISSTPPQPNVELVRRGAIILYNLLEYVVSLQGKEREQEKKRIEADGVQKVLLAVLKVVKGTCDEIIQPVVFSLKMIRDDLKCKIPI
ncbi:smooth muscle cell associated protein-1 isoform 2 [Cryptococcus gattii NT-10]|nr:smooth muscle cell associated protein-1 isoform 2 [Cryptococcus gattii NT-10]